MADLEIGDLVLRIPDLTEAEAGILGRRVAQALADRADRLRGGQFGVVRLRLDDPALKGPALADYIADRVAQALS